MSFTCFLSILYGAPLGPCIPYGMVPRRTCSLTVKIAGLLWVMEYHSINYKLSINAQAELLSTSTKEVMFLARLVGWFVSRIKERLLVRCPIFWQHIQWLRLHTVFAYRRRLHNSLGRVLRSLSALLIIIWNITH